MATTPRHWSLLESFPVDADAFLYEFFLLRFITVLEMIGNSAIQSSTWTLLCLFTENITIHQTTRPIPLFPGYIFR